MTYQERIRGLREDKDLTQRQIADILCVTQTSYSKYETSRQPLPIDYFIALCEYYKVSADYILGFTNNQY